MMCKSLMPGTEHQRQEEIHQGKLPITRSSSQMTPPNVPRKRVKKSVAFKSKEFIASEDEMEEDE